MNYTVSKKKFVLRIDEKHFDALEKWASDEFRSVNGQIEFLLAEALKKVKRLKENDGEDDDKTPS